MEDTTSTEQEQQQQQPQAKDPEFPAFKSKKLKTQQEVDETVLRSRRGLHEAMMKTLSGQQSSTSSNPPPPPFSIPQLKKEMLEKRLNGPQLPPMMSYTENMDPQMAARHIIENAMKREGMFAAQQQQRQRPSFEMIDPVSMMIQSAIKNALLFGAIFLGVYGTYRLGSYLFHKWSPSSDDLAKDSSKCVDITLDE